MKYAAFIFDLDNCLAAADEAGRDLLEPVFEALRRTNRGTLSDSQLALALEDAWRMPLDALAARHGFSRSMLAAAWETMGEIEVRGTLRGYPDLDCVRDLEGLRFLVTSGFRRLQESKVRALGIAPLFTGVFIDALDEERRIGHGARDGQRTSGKERLFAEILDRHDLDPARVLVVGDNPEAEIAAGNRLGMPTAQVLRPGIERGTNATFYIESLCDLKAHPAV